jgi:RimJ/RimL family protein N-acetyltransferase
LRINTFIIYKNDLTKKLPPDNLDPEFEVIKPTLEELDKLRLGKTLPREFYYDKIYNVETCYLAFSRSELAYIHWVFFKGDYSRFLILSDGVAELNYNTTLPKFRGRRLSAKMMAYISKDLQDSGYKKVMGIIHEHNIASIKCIEQAGFKEVRRIKALGSFHKKLKV